MIECIECNGLGFVDWEELVEIDFISWTDVGPGYRTGTFTVLGYLISEFTTELVWIDGRLTRVAVCPYCDGWGEE